MATLYNSIQKAFSFLTPHQGLCPWPTRGCAPGPPGAVPPDAAGLGA